VSEIVVQKTGHRRILTGDNDFVVELFGERIRGGVELGTSARWLISNDVCAACGIKSPHHAAARLEGDKRGLISTKTPGGRQWLVAVSQAGFCDLILDGRKPWAREIRHKITSEVMPALFEHGCYPPPTLAVIDSPTALVRRDESMVIREIVELQAQVQRLEGKVDGIGGTLSAVAVDARRAADAAESVEGGQRREFDQRTVRRMRSAVHRFGGLCPCCGQSQIADRNGEWIAGSYEIDHWVSRADNRPENGWPVCRPCNRKFGSAGSAKRQQFLHFFTVFQERLSAVPAAPRLDDRTLMLPGVVR
jgi:prophage antirepressor-like protein